MRAPVRPPRSHRTQAGIGLAELMICSALGLMLILAAVAALMGMRAAFSTQDDAGRMDESARYALELMARAIRQSGAENWGREGGALLNAPHMSAAIAGLDAATLRESLPALESPVAGANNASDVLAVRYFGSGAGDGDGSVLNCAGAVVSETGGTPDDARAWSIFYIAVSAGGEPELRCKFRTKNNAAWDAEAIVSGVESLQFLYGIDTAGDGLPQRYVNADTLRALDLAGNVSATRSHWKSVVAVRIGLLVRGSEQLRDANSPLVFDLFGKAYSDLNAISDQGVRIEESKMSASERRRLRKIYVATVRLRNFSGGNR